MSNHILIEGKIYQLTDSQAEAIASAIRETGAAIPRKIKLADIAVGDVATICGIEFVVLDQMDGKTVLITKDCIGENTAFSESDNCFVDSIVDDICESFAELMMDAMGEDNLVEFELDLTSDDGLKDCGVVSRKAAPITADMYRKYVDVLDLYKPQKHWWLATPHSTKRHGNDNWVKCVSPSGNVINVNCYGDVNGVRPFCILKSDIFVSC